MQVAFKQVDVFAEHPFLGNPVAVVLDGSALTDHEMQRIAAWTNLSETTFVLPSDRADYRLRIFTPKGELPFAGHPTIGSAHAVIEAVIASPHDGALTQECAAGVIAMRVDGTQIVATVPSPRVVRELAFAAADVTAWLGAPVIAPAPLAIDVGAVWLVAQAESADALSSATPDLIAIADASRAYGLMGVTAFALERAGGATDARMRVRSFAPASGIAEDPVCGSGNAAVGAYLGVTQLLTRTGAEYVASQGREVGRDGRVTVSVRGHDVSIGGSAVTVLDGTIRLR